LVRHKSDFAFYFYETKISREILYISTAAKYVGSYNQQLCDFVPYTNGHVTSDMMVIEAPKPSQAKPSQAKPSQAKQSQSSN
jgi:hypothetical protein